MVSKLLFSTVAWSQTRPNAQDLGAHIKETLFLINK